MTSPPPKKILDVLFLEDDGKEKQRKNDESQRVPDVNGIGNSTKQQWKDNQADADSGGAARSDLVLICRAQLNTERQCQGKKISDADSGNRQADEARGQVEAVQPE